MLAGYRHWLGRGESQAQLWPSYRLRAMARGPIGGHWYESSHNDEAIQEFLERHHGYFREPEVEVDWSKVHAPEPKLSSDGLRGLERLFSLTRRHRTQLLLLHGPIPERFKTPELTRWLHHNEKRLREMAKAHDHVRVQGPFANFAPTKYFFDYQHLFLEGAVINSAIVASKVQAWATEEAR